MCVKRKDVKRHSPSQKVVWFAHSAPLPASPRHDYGRTGGGAGICKEIFAEGWLPPPNRSQTAVRQVQRVSGEGRGGGKREAGCLQAGNLVFLNLELLLQYGVLLRMLYFLYSLCDFA